MDGHELKIAALDFVRYARRVRRLDHDVVMNSVERIERALAIEGVFGSAQIQPNAE